MPEVSIITPVYNSSKFLAQTIDSVFAQTFTD
ncbi:glycosyltransferase [Kaistella montana]|uniref:Glycosyltransferase n=1 Tax=Kaistella montana TaxID=1849733 RepID=A0ABW5KAG7_9FLAO